MKRTVLFLFAVFACANIFGQTATRLVAFAGYGSDTTGAPVDTGGYTYTHGRGGEILCSLAPFRDDYPFVFVPTADFETGHEGIVKSDSSWEMGPGDTDVSTQFFDGNNNIIYSSCLELTSGAWQNYATFSYVYDAHNNLLTEIDTFWQTGIWSTIALNTYAYDLSGRVITAIGLSMDWGDTNWSDGNKTQYTYDTTGELTYLEGLTWNEKNNSWSVANSVYTNFYYAKNQIDSFIDSVAPPQYGGALGIYYFSPTNDTMVVNYYNQLGPLGNYLRRTNTYDTHHNKTSFTQDIVDTLFDLENNTKTEWTYNANNQVTSERNFSKDSSGNWIFTALNRYYYETYETEVPYDTNSISVFPSPAQNNITIKLEWDKSQPFSVAIFDAAGRRAMQWSVPAAQQYEQTINLPYLASGNYFVRAVNGNQQLVKQFVLLH